MLVVETVVRIRREHAGGKPIKEIARDLRLSLKVIRKWRKRTHASDAPMGPKAIHSPVLTAEERRWSWRSAAWSKEIGMTVQALCRCELPHRLCRKFQLLTVREMERGVFRSVRFASRQERHATLSPERARMHLSIALNRPTA
jgi:transposase